MNLRDLEPHPLLAHPLSRSNLQVKAGMRFTVNDNEYVLGGEVGDGAVGVVRKAKRVKDDRVLAVKFLAPDPKYIEVSAFDDVASRFRREGLRGDKLDHLNLLEIYAYCENEDGEAFLKGGPPNPFILMEYIEGRSLESYLRRIPESDREVFRVTEERLVIALQIVDAMGYLHGKKLIHRDVKPANIFLSKSQSSDGRLKAKLGDFGVVRWGDFQSSLATGTLTATSQQGLGTLKYMSPEQAIAPKRVTVKSDIYSIGITLFELFTGQILATHHHVTAVMLARLSRGTAASRFMELGFSLDTDDDSLAELILDMHLRGVDGRPSIRRILGNLEWEYRKRFQKEFVPEF